MKIIHVFLSFVAFCLAMQSGANAAAIPKAAGKWAFTVDYTDTVQIVQGSVNFTRETSRGILTIPVKNKSWHGKIIGGTHTTNSIFNQPVCWLKGKRVPCNTKPPAGQTINQTFDLTFKPANVTTRPYLIRGSFSIRGSSVTFRFSPWGVFKSVSVLRGYLSKTGNEMILEGSDAKKSVNITMRMIRIR